MPSDFSDTGYDSSIKENASVAKEVENSSESKDNVEKRSATDEEIVKVEEGTVILNTCQSVKVDTTTFDVNKVIQASCSTPSSTTNVESIADKITLNIIQAVYQEILNFETGKADVVGKELI